MTVSSGTDYWFLAGLVGLGVGALLLLLALRGRCAGDDPHCRRCGFNLRGREAGGNCPECGADLTRKAATRIGERRRSPAGVVVALAILLASAGVAGRSAWNWAAQENWERYKPLAWVLRDAHATDAELRAAATAELRRRVEADNTSTEDLNRILDAALARQGDRTAQMDRVWADVIFAARHRGRLSEERLERFVRQGMRVELEVKPRLRRVSSIAIGVKFYPDRYGPDAVVSGTWQTSPLKLGDAVVIEDFLSDSTDNHFSPGTGTTIIGAPWNVRKVSDGMHQLHTTVTAKLQLTHPIKSAPVDLELKAAQPIELLPRDAQADEFKADPALRDAMRKSFGAARVGKDSDGRIDVRLQVEQLPMPMAAEAVLVQGSREQPAGIVLIDAHRPKTWQRVFSRHDPKFSGIVDVHLRPSQAAADHTLALATYWGEPIVIPGVQVDAPYEPPFNTDESLRAAVMKSFEPPTLMRNKQTPGYISIRIKGRDAPVRLAYDIFLKAGERELEANSPWHLVPDSSVDSGTRGKDPDPTAARMDVILRPDKDWEVRGGDSNPPWGGEIVFRDVPVGAK